MNSIIQFIKRYFTEETLTIQENYSIHKRGFYVKNFFGMKEFIFVFTFLFSLGGLFLIGIFDLLFGTGAIVRGGDGFMLLILGPGAGILICYLLVVFLLIYIFFDKLFYINGGIYVFGKILKSTKDIHFFWFYFRIIDRLLKGKNIPKTFDYKTSRIGMFLILLLFLGFLFYYLRYSVYIFCSILCVTFISRIILRSFHPLYAFGNLGEKIQSFTPKIEEESKRIQENFQKDQDFKILSDGFDTLSTTFKKIITLVIKLEQVEKKANKGNLFDSTKYINSLREDIVNPLKQLKEFLEDQRGKLENSQEELVKVRVGGPEQDFSQSSKGQEQRGGQEQAELASMRGATLLRELTENIAKLDVMIGKMS